MTLGIQGLRKRSPNPNASPPLDDNDTTSLGQPSQPYSPGLLSPYIHPPPNSHGQSASFSPYAERSPISTYTPFGGITPTIRLIPTHSRSNSETGRTPLKLDHRSRSDDRQYTASPGSAVTVTTTELYRHATEPAYSKLDRGQPRQPFLFSRDPADKPIPPLPLNVRRQSSLRSSTSSLGKSDSALGSEMERESVDAASAGTGRRSWSSLLVNPFRHSSDPRRAPSNTSTRMGSRSMQMLSKPMLRSTHSLSSNATISDLLDHNPYKKRAEEPKDTGARITSEMLARVRSAGGDKITSKFPERVDTVEEAWSSFKIVLLMSVLALFGYGLAGLCWSLQIMLRVSPSSDVTMASDPDVVTFLLFFSLLSLFTSFVGLTGTLLSSRPILAFYNLLLWPTFISLALVGYTSYKRGNLQLDRKLNQVWSQFLTDQDRLRIQNELSCCGYYNPYHDATYSKRCYPRTSLAGCKARWTMFEQEALHDFATAAFSTIPIHLINIIIALVCSNHVDQQFGKGLTPLKYRLEMADVRANAMAILTSLPAQPGRSPSSASLLKRSSAMRGSRRSEKGDSPSTVSLVGHKRQYSIDSHFSHRRESEDKGRRDPRAPYSDPHEETVELLRRQGAVDADSSYRPDRFLPKFSRTRHHSSNHIDGGHRRTRTLDQDIQ